MQKFGTMKQIMGGKERGDMICAEISLKISSTKEYKKIKKNIRLEDIVSWKKNKAEI